MKKRIIGIDLARALAVIGMIIVNFKIVFGKEGSELLQSVAAVFDGKAAATFVVLAGVGIALMIKSALVNKDQEKIRKTKIRIIKRAIFLFVIGLSYLSIWPADILHFYGIYMLVLLLFFGASQKIIKIAYFVLIFSYPFLIMLINYETGWDFSTLSYLDFWTGNGFFRNLFYNGFHPVVPWSAFMLLGFWFGAKDLNDNIFVKKAMKFSLISFIGLQLFSIVAIRFFSDGDAYIAHELDILIGTSPMPPLPIYMLTGSSIAIFVITFCILLARRFENNKIILALNKMGQLALTFYVAHVIIGMGMVEAFGVKELGSYSIEFSVAYALFFSLCCILFAVLCLRFNKIGPLEWVMRKIVD